MQARCLDNTKLSYARKYTLEKREVKRGNARLDQGLNRETTLQVAWPIHYLA